MGPQEGTGLTTHSFIVHMGYMAFNRTMGRRSPVAKHVKDLTTIQLTSATRDRLYRLKFRRTYDEFLQELCEIYERGSKSVQK